MSFWDKMLSFEGRMRRRDYWLYSMVVGMMFGVLYLALVIPVALTNGHGDPKSVGIVTVLIYLAALWPSLAICAKRCHDRDQSMVMLLILIVPIIGSLWGFINLGLMDGTGGANQYGPSPKVYGGSADFDKIFA